MSSVIISNIDTNKKTMNGMKGVSELWNCTCGQLKIEKCCCTAIDSSFTLRCGTLVSVDASAAINISDQ